MEKKESLRQKICDKLAESKTRSECTRRVLKNLDELRNISDNDLRIKSNNERLGIPGDYYLGWKYPEKDWDFMGSTRYVRLDFFDSYGGTYRYRENLLRAFAKTGDKLSKKIVDFIDSPENKKKKHKELKFGMIVGLVEGLVSRSIAEPTYNSLLSGKYPISWYGNRYYLPKQRNREGFVSRILNYFTKE